MCLCNDGVLYVDISPQFIPLYWSPKTGSQWMRSVWSSYQLFAEIRLFGTSLIRLCTDLSWTAFLCVTNTRFSSARHLKWVTHNGKRSLLFSMVRMCKLNVLFIIQNILREKYISIILFKRYSLFFPFRKVLQGWNYTRKPGSWPWEKWITSPFLHDWHRD